MKRNVLLTLISLCLVSFSAKSQEFGGGSGTLEDPYLISTVQHLKNIRLYSPTLAGMKYYKLTADIDMSSVENWMPLSRTEAGDKGTERAFLHLDGNGHIIKNLTSKIDRAISSGYAGLVGVLVGSVKNLGMVNVDIDSDGAGAITGYVGSLAGTNGETARIENCFVTGKVYGVGKLGGIAGCIGRNGSYIKNCYSTTETRNFRTAGSDYVGGITGVVSGNNTTNPVIMSYVEFCYATGAISGLHMAVAGVAGWTDGAIRNSVALNKSITNDGTDAANDLVGTISMNGGYATNVGAVTNNIARTGIPMSLGGSPYTPQNFNTGVAKTATDGVEKSDDYLSNAINYYSDLFFPMAGEEQVWAQETYQIYPQLLWVYNRADRDQIDGLRIPNGSTSEVAFNELKLSVVGKQISVSGITGSYQLSLYTPSGSLVLQKTLTAGEVLSVEQAGIYVAAVVADKDFHSSVVVIK